MKSVSVFIKTSFTIFTASPSDLLSLLPQDGGVGGGVFVVVKALTLETDSPTGVSLVPDPGQRAGTTHSQPAGSHTTFRLGNKGAFLSLSDLVDQYRWSQMQT